jgi:hypothetical protein
MLLGPIERGGRGGETGQEDLDSDSPEIRSLAYSRTGQAPIPSPLDSPVVEAIRQRGAGVRGSVPARFKDIAPLSRSTTGVFTNIDQNS